MQIWGYSYACGCAYAEAWSLQFRYGSKWCDTNTNVKTSAKGNMNANENAATIAKANTNTNTTRAHASINKSTNTNTDTDSDTNTDMNTNTNTFEALVHSSQAHKRASTQAHPSTQSQSSRADERIGAACTHRRLPGSP
jgi:hypothetical protein